jgi:hypothetical protein
MDSHALSMDLTLLGFKDDNIYNIYCPALTLVGCGYTEKEANDSFNIVLEEYIRYTTENQTLIKDLESLGWNMRGKKPIPPKISESIQTNEELENIFNNYDFVKHSIPVEMPFV